MVGMMNKNLPAFLWHMILEQSLPKNFINDLIKKSCRAYMVAKQSTCIWDATTRTLTTVSKAARETDTKAFEGCDNFHSWISLSGDLVFSHQQGIHGSKFPKRFFGYLFLRSHFFSSSSSLLLIC
jgi:hypothetical protein